MRLIVGLGNPGREYKHTRHNIGFETVNKLAYDNDVDIGKSKFNAHIGDGFIRKRKVLLAQPQTYMNLSGCAVRDICHYYKIPLEELIVIYDDTDLPLGTIRIRESGGPGGHNGMKSILYHLGTDQFIRVRVGIGKKPPEWVLSNYVLSHFLPEEMEDMVKGVTLASLAVETIVCSGAVEAMNQYNRNSNK